MKDLLGTTYQIRDISRSRVKYVIIHGKREMKMFPRLLMYSGSRSTSLGEQKRTPEKDIQVTLTWPSATSNVVARCGEERSTEKPVAVARNNNVKLCVLWNPSFPGETSEFLIWRRPQAFRSELKPPGSTYEPATSLFSPCRWVPLPKLGICWRTENEWTTRGRSREFDQAEARRSIGSSSQPQSAHLDRYRCNKFY